MFFTVFEIRDGKECCYCHLKILLNVCCLIESLIREAWFGNLCYWRYPFRPHWTTYVHILRYFKDIKLRLSYIGNLLSDLCSLMDRATTTNYAKRMSNINLWNELSGVTDFIFYKMLPFSLLYFIKKI